MIFSKGEVDGITALFDLSRNDFSVRGRPRPPLSSSANNQFCDFISCYLFLTFATPAFLLEEHKHLPMPLLFPLSVMLFPSLLQQLFWVPYCWDFTTLVKIAILPIYFYSLYQFTFLYNTYHSLTCYTFYLFVWLFVTSVRVRIFISLAYRFVSRI